MHQTDSPSRVFSMFSKNWYIWKIFKGHSCFVSTVANSSSDNIFGLIKLCWFQSWKTAHFVPCLTQRNPNRRLLPKQRERWTRRWTSPPTRTGWTPTAKPCTIVTSSRVWTEWLQPWTTWRPVSAAAQPPSLLFRPRLVLLMQLFLHFFSAVQGFTLTDAALNTRGRCWKGGRRGAEVTLWWWCLTWPSLMKRARRVRMEPSHCAPSRTSRTVLSTHCRWAASPAHCQQNIAMREWKHERNAQEKIWVIYGEEQKSGFQSYVYLGVSQENQDIRVKGPAIKWAQHLSGSNHWLGSLNCSLLARIELTNQQPLKSQRL